MRSTGKKRANGARPFRKGFNHPREGGVSGVGSFGGRINRCAWAPMQRTGDDLGQNIGRSDRAERNLR